LNKILEHIEGKKHVIWDWNGTVLNDVDHSIATINQVLVKRKIESIDHDRYKKIFEFPVINYYKTLGFDFSIEPFEDICHEIIDLYMSGFKSCPLIPGAKEILSNLNQKGLNQSILSASDQESLDDMINHFELESYFSFVFGIEDKLASSKIHRGLDLIQASNINPDDTVLIGDTSHDLEVGEHLGVDVLLVGHGHQCPLKLKSIHHSVVH